MSDPLDIHNEQQRREDAQERARLAEQNRVEDIKWLMSGKRGRRIVWGLLEQTGVFRSSFRLNNEMAFLEGQRNVGLILLALIHEHSPDAYVTMLKEQQANG